MLTEYFNYRLLCYAHGFAFFSALIYPTHLNMLGGISQAEIKWKILSLVIYKQIKTRNTHLAWKYVNHLAAFLRVSNILNLEIPLGQ
jgi:hypothetical protein